MPDNFLDAKEQISVLEKGILELISHDELLTKLKKSQSTNTPLNIKAGFDPTASDLHIGHLVLLNKLKQFQSFGHNVIFLIGDFTTSIGDPSGRNELRPTLSTVEIEENSKTYHDQVCKILDIKKTRICYNSGWMKKLTPSDLISLMSKYTVSRMVERDDFKNRLAEGKPLFIHELFYPLAQGYDSVFLKSDVELGGSDQKFNLLVGRDLQKSYGQSPQCVITLPLLEGIDGKRKMSKTFQNQISLMDSPANMFGKIMSISDDQINNYFELLFNVDTNELSEINAMKPKDQKVKLAKDLIIKFHGEEEAEKAQKEFDKVFREKGVPDEIPTVILNPQTIWICKLLVQLSLSSSTSEAKRFIQGSGVKIEGCKVEDFNLKLELKNGKDYILSVGKRKFVKVRVGGE